MGVQDAGKEFLNPAAIKTNLGAICKRHTDAKPVAAIDVAIPINKALANNQAIDQAMAIPPMPASHVANYVWEFVSLFVSAGFTTITVFDGRRYAPKQRTNERRYGNKDEEERKLFAMYSNHETAYTIAQIRKQQQKALRLTEDVFYEVAEKLKKEGIRTICAPYEADSQLVALSRQGIIDYAVTDDSDIPFQGATGTIRKVTKKGACQLVRFDAFQSHLANIFKAESMLIKDIAVLAALLGNDYVDRASGKGPAATKDLMKQYCSANNTPSDKAKILRDYLNHHFNTQEEQKPDFWISLQSWEHAPAFIVTSQSAQKTAREAFLSATSEDVDFKISLGPMSHCDHQGEIPFGENFWFYQDSDDNQPGRGTLKLGFIPSNDSEFQGADEHKFLRYFNLEVWCRTGQALKGLVPLRNTNNDVVWPGAVLYFDQRPIKTYPDWVLSNWLCARDVSCDDYDRNMLINEVEKGLKQDPPLFILPQFILKGAGGYTSYECLEPATDEGNVSWMTGDAALAELRSLPTISEEYFTKIFGPRNGSRRRAYLHVTGGSFDLKNLRVTRDLQAGALIREDHQLVVIQATCTASQKLGKCYELRMAFRCDKGFDGERFQRLPITRCECPVGCWICAHLGALLLLTRVVQQKECQFRELERWLPDPIGQVVNLPIPIGYIFPRYASKINKQEVKRRKRIMKKAGFSVEGDRDFEEDEEDEEFGENDEDEEETALEVDMIANPGCEEEIVDVTGRVSNVIERIDQWMALQDAREADTGQATKIGVEAVRKASIQSAQPPCRDKDDFATQLHFFQRLYENRSVSTLAEDRNLMDLYLHINIDDIKEQSISLRRRGATVQTTLPDVRNDADYELPDAVNDEEEDDMEDDS